MDPLNHPLATPLISTFSLNTIRHLKAVHMTLFSKNYPIFFRNCPLSFKNAHFVLFFQEMTNIFGEMSFVFRNIQIYTRSDGTSIETKKAL